MCISKQILRFFMQLIVILHLYHGKEQLSPFKLYSQKFWYENNISDFWESSVPIIKILLILGSATEYILVSCRVHDLYWFQF